MRAWVYKVNSQRPGRFTGPARRSLGDAGGPARRSLGVGGWHFDQYFRYRGKKPYDMGGRDWIRSPQSWARLRRVRRGDLFVCYQADERRVYGLARAASDGYESLEGSGVFDSVDFHPRGLRLETPVQVTQAAVREVFAHIRAFTVPSRGTIHALARDELRALRRVLVESNPRQVHPIRRMMGAG